MKLQFLATLAAIAAAQAAAALPLGVKLYGLNYDRRKGVDWAPVKCKTRDEVFADMDVMATMTERVRLYGMGEGACATSDVLDAARGKMKVALGVWPANDGNFANELRILENLLKAGQIDGNIDGIHVGSEAIYRKDYSADKAIDYLRQVRDLLKRYGKTDIKLTIADVVDSYYRNPQLVDAVDEVSINQFTFWEKKNVNEGMPIMLDRIRSIRRQAANAGKNVLVSETGWASAGIEPNASIASVANQRQFFIDFYQQATAQQLPYFWFAAFDNLWLKDNKDSSEVERYFGVMNFDRTLKESFGNIGGSLAPRNRVTFKSPSSGRYLAEAVNPDRIEEVTGVEMLAESSDKLMALRYQWFYDAAKGQVRSLNSDRCLDAYEAWNGGRVHVWTCSDSEPNQKWTYDASTKQLKHGTHKGFCLDNDPNQNYLLHLWSCMDNNANQQYETGMVVPESNAVRLIAKESKDPKTIVQLVRNGENVAAAVGAQIVAGSEWTFDSATGLVRAKDSDYCLDAYEGWNGGRVHVWQCNPSEKNQRWSFDSSTGQVKHLTYNGFCLDNDQANNVIQLWGCHLNNNNQVWRMVSTSAKVAKITNTDLSVAEWVSRDQLTLATASAKDSQVWFYNSYKNTIVNKWSGECLDADQPYDGGRVHTWDCIASEGNQKWTVENGLVKHATHKGLCLASKTASDKALVLKTCSNSDATQSLTLSLP